MTELALVALGGGLGAVTRYAIVRALPAHFPWGVFIANIVGSLLLGILLAGAGHDLRLLAGVGFCGGLTTFSTFSVDTLVLAREGRPAAATMNVVASTAACLAAIAIGLLVGAALGLSA